MRGGLPGARWIDPENYHLTLRFIDDIDDALAHEIAGVLGRVHRGALRAAARRTDLVFGGRKPRALVASVAPIAPLIELQAEHERLLQRLGLEPEGPQIHTTCHAGATARQFQLGRCRLSRRPRPLSLRTVSGFAICAVLVARGSRRQSLYCGSRLSACRAGAQVGLIMRGHQIPGIAVAKPEMPAHLITMHLAHQR